MDDNVKHTIDDAANGITALQLAVDTLGRIAEFGGVQGEWAVQTLVRINDVMHTGYQRVPLRSVPDALDRAAGGGR